MFKFIQVLSINVANSAMESPELNCYAEND